MIPSRLKTDVLPQKLSALLLQAVGDLELCEQDPRYKVNMNHWHFYSDWEGVCYVCLAGAMLAQTMQADPTRTMVTKAGFPMEARVALDSLRTPGLEGIAAALRGFYPRVWDQIKRERSMVEPVTDLGSRYWKKEEPLLLGTVALRVLEKVLVQDPDQSHFNYATDSVRTKKYWRLVAQGLKEEGF